MVSVGQRQVVKPFVASGAYKHAEVERAFQEMGKDILSVAGRDGEVEPWIGAAKFLCGAGNKPERGGLSGADGERSDKFSTIF